jgi:hypothetical protein
VRDLDPRTVAQKYKAVWAHRTECCVCQPLQALAAVLLLSLGAALSWEYLPGRRPDGARQVLASTSTNHAVATSDHVYRRPRTWPPARLPRQGNTLRVRALFGVVYTSLTQALIPDSVPSGDACHATLVAAHQLPRSRSGAANLLSRCTLFIKPAADALAPRHCTERGLSRETGGRPCARTNTQSSHARR